MSNDATAVTTQHEEPTPLDLHDLYRRMASAGFSRPLTLTSGGVQSISARMRGIQAIAAVFTAAADTEALTLGDWLRGGLIEAISSLASDTQDELERADKLAKAV